MSFLYVCMCVRVYAYDSCLQTMVSNLRTNRLQFHTLLLILLLWILHLSPKNKWITTASYENWTWVLFYEREPVNKLDSLHANDSAVVAVAAVKYKLAMNENGNVYRKNQNQTPNEYKLYATKITIVYFQFVVVKLNKNFCMASQSQHL